MLVLSPALVTLGVGNDNGPTGNSAELLPVELPPVEIPPPPHPVTRKVSANASNDRLVITSKNTGIVFMNSPTPVGPTKQDSELAAEQYYIKSEFSVILGAQWVILSCPSA